MEKTNKSIYSGSHLKKILTKGFWYFLSSIFTKIIGIILLPIITRCLEPSEYGVLSTLESIMKLLPIFISLSLDFGYFRFCFNYNQSKEYLKKLISTYFWFILVWGILVFFISLFIGKIFLTGVLNIDFFPYIPLTMIGPLFLQLSIIGRSYLRQGLKSEIYSIIDIVLFFIQSIIFVYLLVFMKAGIISKIIGISVSNILSFIIFTFIMIKSKLLGFKFSKDVFFEGLKYSLLLIPNQLSKWITGLSDRLMLVIFTTTNITGIYSLGYNIGQTLQMFSFSIFNVYSPIMMAMLVDDKHEGIKRINKFITNYFFIMFLLAYSISFFSEELVVIFASSKYQEAYTYTPIVAFGYFFGAISMPFLEIILYHKKTWVISLGAILQALCNISLNYLLIPKYGSIIAAWTTLLANLIYFIWVFIFSQRLDKISILWSKIIKIILLGLIVFIIFLFFNKFLISLERTVIKVILLIILFIVSIKLKVIELKELKQIISRKKIL